MKNLFAVALIVISATPAVAQPPTALQLAHLRLQGGFTLKYLVTVQDVRTPARRVAEMATQRQGIAQAVRDGHMTQAQADQNLADSERAFAAQRPIERFLVTLSGRDGRLLYLSTRGSTIEEPVVKKVVILDGDKAYEADGRDAASVYQDGWRSAPVYRDQNVDRLDFCPLPGVALPGVDLIQSPRRVGTTPGGLTRFSGLVPRLNLMDGDTPYVAGEIEATASAGRLKVISVTVGPQTSVYQKWVVTGDTLFQGHWVGSRMRMTEFDDGFGPSPTTGGDAADTPLGVVDYQLMTASNQPQEASAFALGTYVNAGVSVFADARRGSFSFPYRAGGGSLEQQADRARALQDASAPAQGQP